MKHLIVIIGLTFFIGCAFNQPLTLNHSKTVGKSIHEAASDGDTVLVYPGEYQDQVLMNGKSIVLGSLMLTTGDEDYIEQTVIKYDNSNDPYYAMMKLNVDLCSGDICYDNRTKIYGFTFEDGSNVTYMGSQIGIYGYYNPTLDNLSDREIYLTVEHCHFTGNGMLHNVGGHSTSGSLTLKNCKFIDGGGYPAGARFLTLNQCTVCARYGVKKGFLQFTRAVTSRTSRTDWMESGMAWSSEGTEPCSEHSAYMFV